MYFRIPEDLKASLERQVQRRRLISWLLFYPLVVLIFGGAGMVFLFTEGHVILWMIKQAVGGQYTEDQTLAGVFAVTLAGVAVVMAFISRATIRERIFEEHAFCPVCDAVDKDDEHACPFCHRPLGDRRTFFVTNFDDEARLAERLGFPQASEV